jgi:hypothetical protein
MRTAMAAAVLILFAPSAVAVPTWVPLATALYLTRPRA